MSRAFVRESQQDTASESLPERPISPHPNLVTPEGLKRIEAHIRSLEAERQNARDEEDASALARIARDLRYWNQRKATARVIEPPASPDAVRFGVRVTMRFADGSEKAFRLVGEDEADPAKELLSWVSPLAQTLSGQKVGDTVMVMGREAEIVTLAS